MKKSLILSAFFSIHSLHLASAQEAKQDPAPAKPSEPAKLAPLQFIPEKVTDTFQKGKTWVINEKFAAAHKAEPIDHAPFVVSVMPSKEGKLMYLTRPKVSELIRFSFTTKDKKLAESIRFTTLNMPTTMPMDVRLAKSAELLEKQLFPNFATGQKNLAIGKKYKTKVGPYNAAVVLGKLTTKDGSTLFMKAVAILRQNNRQGLIAVMFLDPSSGKKEDLKQRLANGDAQQLLHSVRFLKKKAPDAAPKEKPASEIKKE